jgi:hypothetical protein
MMPLLKENGKLDENISSLVRKGSGSPDTAGNGRSYRYSARIHCDQTMVI